MSWLSSWKHRIKLTIDHTKVASDLTWFPVMVRLSASCGSNAQDLTKVFDELGSNSLKIAFTDSSGNQLFCEIEKWDAAGEEAILWVSKAGWVISSSADTVFYLYYGSTHADNSEYVGVEGSTPGKAVWDSSFVLVDHMKDGADTSHTADSLGVNNGAKKGANEPIQAAGKAGNGQSFDGSDDKIDYGDGSALHSVGDLTLEAVVNVPNATGHRRIISKSENSPWWLGYELSVYDANNKIEFIAGNGGPTAGGGVGWTSTGVLQAGQYYHIAGRYDRSENLAEIYLNGAFDSSRNTAVIGETNNHLYIGISQNINLFQKGVMDEIRISSSARSAAWITATYNTLWDTFLSFSLSGRPGVVVNGTEITTEQGSLSIENRIEERSTSSFTIIDTSGAGSYLRGHPVHIFDHNYDLIFSGFIDTPEKARLGAAGLLHNIECMDNHYLADKRLVAKSYSQKTLGYIVTDLFNSYLSAEGVTIGEIQTGPTIESAIFNYVKISDAFDALKELSGYTWRINELKALYFVDRSTIAAPWNLDNSTYKPIQDSVHLSTGNPFYRNRQYIRGGMGVTSAQTEHFTGDGTLKSFTLGYPLAREPVITEDSVSKTVGIRGVETGKDYYWNKGDNAITAEVAPTTGVDVQVDYYGQYPVISLVTDSTSELARKTLEGGTGIVEDIQTEAQHESAEASQESAKGKIQQYSQNAEKFTYQTTESGLAPGQLQQITYSPFGFTAHDMLIESVTITADGNEFLYNVSCITGPSAGGWARFFANLLRRQESQVRIGDSVLLALLQQQETLELIDETNIHSDDFTSGIVNRWIAKPTDQKAGHNVEHEKIDFTEETDLTSHATEDYHWGDADMKWGFFTWG